MRWQATTLQRWVPLWSSGPNNVDREHREHPILFDWLTQRRVALFCTRRECQAWINEHYGYIRRMPDLRKYPHDWRMPRAVRVDIKVTPCPKLQKKHRRPRPVQRSRSVRD